jgi:hypothetical protein
VALWGFDSPTCSGSEALKKISTNCPRCGDAPLAQNSTWQVYGLVCEGNSAAASLHVVNQSLRRGLKHTGKLTFSTWPGGSAGVRFPGVFRRQGRGKGTRWRRSEGHVFSCPANFVCMSVEDLSSLPRHKVLKLYIKLHVSSFTCQTLNSEMFRKAM